MRIALVLSHYFPYGGMQRDFLGIARALAGLGHQCTVYCQSWRGDMPAQVDVRILPVPFGLSRMANHRRLQKFAQLVQQALSREHADAVVGFEKMPDLDICFVPDACFAARAARDRGFLYRLTPRYRQFVRWEKAVFDPLNESHILCVSAAQLREYQALYHTPEERTHVLPPGLLLDRKAADAPGARSSAQLREELGLGQDELAVLFVGSSFKTKGLDRAIEGFARLVELRPEIRCRMLVVGADTEGRYRRLASARGIDHRVRFLGARTDVLQIMRATDVMLHPARTEAGGAVLLEALVAGLPVIASGNCGHAHHIIEAGAGVVLPEPYEQSALIAALLHATDTSWRAACSQSAQHYVQTQDLYGMHATAAQIIDARLRAGVGGEKRSV